MKIKYIVHKYDEYGEWLGDQGYYDILEEAIVRHKELVTKEEFFSVYTIEVMDLTSSEVKLLKVGEEAIHINLNEYRNTNHGEEFDESQLLDDEK